MPLDELDTVIRGVISREIEEGLPWQRLIDTYDADAAQDEFGEDSIYDLRPATMAVFRMGREQS